MICTLAYEANGNITGIVEGTSTPSWWDTSWQTLVWNDTKTPSVTTIWNSGQVSQFYMVNNNAIVANPNGQNVQLQQTKDQRIAYLNSQYVQTLAKGFSSSALSTAYTYGLADSDEKEWKALNVALTRGAYPTAGYPLKCYDSTGTPQYLMHTQVQAEQVLLDGSTFGLNQLSNLRTKTNDVNAVQLANYTTLQDAENAVNAVTY